MLIPGIENYRFGIVDSCYRYGQVLNRVVDCLPLVPMLLLVSLSIIHSPHMCEKFAVSLPLDRLKTVCLGVAVWPGGAIKVVSEQ